MQKAEGIVAKFFSKIKKRNSEEVKPPKIHPWFRSSLHLVIGATRRLIFLIVDAIVFYDTFLNLKQIITFLSSEFKLNIF